MMKCEIVRDLLPLYVDGLTSDVSSKEIEKHLKSCKECQKYYQEIAGEIPNAVHISDEEIQEIDLIKKIRKKERWKVTGFLTCGFLAASVICVLFFSWAHRPLKYSEAIIDYGIRGNQVYCTIETRPGYQLFVSGVSKDNDMNVKILSVMKPGSSQDGQIGWECEIGTEEDPCRWTIEFQEKTIVIENGKLTDEIEKD